MPSHRMAPHSKRQVSKEAHYFGFRGCWLPPKVFELVQDRELTGTDLLVLVIVDALYDPDKLGCWASNKYLSQRVGVGPLPVSRSISKLVKSGLIEVVQKSDPSKNACRILRTSWSYCTDEQRGIYSRSIGGHIPGKYTNTPCIKNEYLSPSGDGESGDGMDGLIDMGTPVKTKLIRGSISIEKEDWAFADKLHNWVVAAGKTKRWSRTAWATEFARLRAEVGSARIEAALDWYCNHIKDPYSPQAWCGKSFRLKFDRVESGLKRYQHKNPIVTITPLATETVTMLRKVGWPKDSDKQLPVVVQLSINNAKKFRQFVEARVKTSNFCESKLFPTIRDYQNLVYLYMKGINKRLRNWTKWSGDLMPWVWTVEKFAPDGAGLARKWGNPKDWDKLLEEYNESNKA